MLILINFLANLGNDEEETENNEMLPRNNKRKKNNKQITASNDSKKEGKQLSTCIYIAYMIN